MWNSGKVPVLLGRIGRGKPCGKGGKNWWNK